MDVIPQKTEKFIINILLSSILKSMTIHSQVLPFWHDYNHNPITRRYEYNLPLKIGKDFTISSKILTEKYLYDERKRYFITTHYAKQNTNQMLMCTDLEGIPVDIKNINGCKKYTFKNKHFSKCCIRCKQEI